MSGRRLDLAVQYAGRADDLPDRPRIRAWVRAALDADKPCGGQITVRFVDADEGRQLNRAYRGKDYATNVLSFPYATDPSLCGDLAVCAPVAEREAAVQCKKLEAHYAHLVVHGVLHLRGFDHEAGEDEARRMEDLERAILATLGYADPYRSTA